MSKEPIVSDRLDVKAVSALTGLKISTLNHWRTTGEGPVFFKFGSRVFYPLDGLVEFMNARRFRSTAEARRKRDLRRAQLGAEPSSDEPAAADGGAKATDSTASSMA